MTLLPLWLSLLGGANSADHLSLPNALDRLDAGNHQIEAAKARIATAEETRKAGRGNFLPVIRLEASAQHLDRDLILDLDPIRSAMVQLQANDAVQLKSLSSAMAGAPLTPAQQAQVQQAATGQLDAKLPHFVTTIKEQDHWTGNLSVYQPLFHGGKILAAHRVNTARVTAAQAEKERQSSDLRRDFTRLYLQGTLLQQSLKLRLNAQEAILRHRNRATQLVEQGMADKAALLRAEMALADSRTALSDDSMKLESISLTLGQMSGSATNILPTDPLPPPPLGIPVETGASGPHPLLASLSAQEDVASRAVSVKTADFLPEIGAFGKYELNRDALSALDPYWVVGVRASITLFRGGNDWYSRRAALSTRREVAAMREEAKSALLAQSQRQQLAMEQSRRRWENLKAQGSLARENHRVTEMRFAQGQATGLEVVDAWLLMQKADLEQLAAAADAWISLEEILWANGRTREFASAWTTASFAPGVRP
ncbi:MAG: outer membrane protein TolC [Fibrobacterota bacterium]|jgi:outer membrane protein TolC